MTDRSRRRPWPALIALAAVVLLLFAGGRVGKGLGGTLALLLSAPYWLGPVMVWRTNRSRVPAWHVSSDAAFDALPVEVRPFFEHTGRDLQQCGFILVAVLHETNLVPGYATWVSVHVKRPAHQRAVVVAHLPANPLAPVKPKPAFYFRTAFGDGRVIETGNIDEPNVFPPLPRHDNWQFPEIADVRRLHELHDVLLGPFGSASRDPIPEGGEVAHLTRAMLDFYRAHVGTGYLRVIEPDRVFGPTVKGAALMTWKLLPPMSWLARAKVRDRNRAFLATHTVGGIG